MESLMIPVYALVIGFIVIILQQLLIFWRGKKINNILNTHKTVLERLKRETSISYLAERIGEYKDIVKHLETRIKQLEL